MNNATEQIIEVYDRLGETYDDEFLRPIDIIENDWTFRYLADALEWRPFGGNIVDVGCGTGLVLENLEIPANEYIGVDISETMLKVAKGKFPDYRFERSDVLEYEPARRVAAVISTFASMSYVIDGAERLPELFASWLKPEGVLFLQFFGRRYCPNRSDFTTNVPTTFATKAELLRLYSPYFEDLRVVGINFAADRFPYKWYFDLEAATVGRVRPDAGLFLILTGTRKSDIGIVDNVSKICFS